MIRGDSVAGVPLSHDDPRPLHEQLAALIRAEIEAGTLAGRLPTEASLMARHGVSRDTVRRALTALAEAGLITSHRGRGWFVRPRPL